MRDERQKDRPKKIETDIDKKIERKKGANTYEGFNGKTINVKILKKRQNQSLKTPPFVLC